MVMSSNGPCCHNKHYPSTTIQGTSRATRTHFFHFTIDFFLEFNKATHWYLGYIAHAFKTIFTICMLYINQTSDSLFLLLKCKKEYLQIYMSVIIEHILMSCCSHIFQMSTGLLSEVDLLFFGCLKGIENIFSIRKYCCLVEKKKKKIQKHLKNLISHEQGIFLFLKDTLNRVCVLAYIAINIFVASRSEVIQLLQTDLHVL